MLTITELAEINGTGRTIDTTGIPADQLCDECGPDGTIERRRDGAPVVCWQCSGTKDIERADESQSTRARLGL
jgi:hypothetical protein